MEIQQNFSLKQMNTFNFECIASYYAEINNISEIQELIQTEVFRNEKRFILGGGSNVLFTKKYEGLIIHPNFKGVEVIEEDETSVILKMGSTEIWENMVEYTVSKAWSGIENLAAIPGSVGAAPVQNIGAYGVELKDVFLSLTAVNLLDGSIKEFDKSACEFEYRNSVFKSKFKNQYLITSVSIRLKKNAKSQISYEALSSFLKKENLQPTLENVYQAIVQIRASKLPDHKILGNAGSFFKNPVITAKKFEELKLLFPDIKSYPQHKGNQKIAAGWLVESCGWKGKKFHGIGVHEKQALVLVNYGSGEGSQVARLAELIIKSVEEKFGILLEPEVNIL
jgi:UDP-N-acetylmuramate dehydrogenase